MEDRRFYVLRNRTFPFDILLPFSMAKILLHIRRQLIIHGCDFFFSLTKRVNGKDSDSEFSPFHWPHFLIQPRSLISLLCLLCRSWRVRTGMRWCTTGSAPRAGSARACGLLSTSLCSPCLETVSFLKCCSVLPAWTSMWGGGGVHEVVVMLVITEGR